MIDYLPWIPDFSYFEHKIENLFNIDKTIDFLKQKIKANEIFQSNEELYWIIVLLFHIDKLNLLDKKAVKKYILELKYHKGGYKFSDKFEEPDTWSTFYCIAILKYLELDDLIEDNDIEFVKKSQNLESGSAGGFIHCISKNCPVNCNKKTSVKSSFFALSTLTLLDKLNEIDIEHLVNYLDKNASNNMDLIYQILCLKMLDDMENINLEKKTQIILSWQQLKSGFGIESNFPSMKNNYWSLICLEQLNKLDLIDFGGILDFIRSMEENDGGFTDQYSSLSQNVPNIRTTVQSLLCIFIVWKKLIELIENEILIQANDSSEIDLIPISDKFSISVKFVKEIASWLISNEWIEGKIFNRKKKFKSHFNKQNAITQEIINKFIDVNKTNPELKKLNLNEFSKSFDFTNALERVKLVMNDLIINNLLTGTIITKKRDPILDNFLVLRECVHLNKPFTSYEKIMNEKKRSEDAKNRILNLHKDLTKFIKTNSEKLKRSIDEEKITKVKKQFHDNCDYVETQIQKFENLITQIKSNHEFIKSEFLNLKIDKDWPILKNSIEKYFSKFKLDINDKIKEKEVIIAERIEKAKNQEAIKTVENHLHDIEIRLMQYEFELGEFFQKNYTNHDKTLSFIKTISDYIEKSNSSLSSKISKTLDIIKFDEFKKKLDKLNISWTERREQLENVIKSYQNIVGKRKELEEFITENISLLQKFSEEKYEQITSLIKNNEIEKSSNILNRRIDEFNERSADKNEIFYVTLDQINQEIVEFPKFSSDIKLDWNKKLEDQKIKWDNFTSELKDLIHIGKEIEKRNELEQNLEENIEDFQSFIENMKNVVLKLIKEKYLDDADNKTRENYLKIEKKINKYNQTFKDFIKTSATEFKSFRENIKDLIENWEKEKTKLFKILNITKDELEGKIKSTGFSEKKKELHELIKTNISSLENKIVQLKSNYNQFIQSGKKLSEFESKLQSEISKIRNDLKTSNIETKNFIKTESRIYESFNEKIEEELKFWNNSKSSIKQKFEILCNTIEEDIFIDKIQFFVKAFKDNEVNINYLSKMLKMKSEPLKMKLITLISNSRLKGKLDFNADKFILEEELLPNEISDKTIKNKKIKEELDPISKDILNLRFLIVIQKNMGASVFNRKLGEWYMDSDLIGGFLTAIQGFSSEIKKKDIPIKRMEYKDFQIILEQGKYIFAALFIDGEESDWLRNKLQLFVESFENIHADNLKHWKGELASFKNSGYLIDTVFELYRV